MSPSVLASYAMPNTVSQYTASDSYQSSPFSPSTPQASHFSRQPYPLSAIDPSLDTQQSQSQTCPPQTSYSETSAESEAELQQVAQDWVLPPERIYNSFAELYTAAQSWGLERGYSLTTERTSNIKNNGRKKGVLACNRREKPRPNMAGSDKTYNKDGSVRRKGAAPKGTGCKFGVNFRQMKDGMWALSHREGRDSNIHNHVLDPTNTEIFPSKERQERIARKYDNLPRPKGVTLPPENIQKGEVLKWTAAQMAQYLGEKGISEECCRIFEEQDIDGEAALAMGKEDVMRNELSFGLVGPRLRIWKHIEALHLERMR